MNKTETQLSNICKKNNWFCVKLNTHNISGNATSQVSDFLVANTKGVYAIECKERGQERFDLNDLTQSLSMRKLIKKSNKLIPYILLNYYKFDKLFLFTYMDYKEIKIHNKFKNGKIKKSFNYKDIPVKYQIQWKTLKDVI